MFSRAGKMNFLSWQDDFFQTGNQPISHIINNYHASEWSNHQGDLIEITGCIKINYIRRYSVITFMRKQGQQINFVIGTLNLKLSTNKTGLKMEDYRYD